MDNRIGSQIKRGLKVTGDYLVSLVIFGIFSSAVLSLFKENLEQGITIFSVIIFLIMLLMMYNNMKETAVKEKRPQYNINPPPHKGFLYGIIGVLPIFILQLLYYVVQVPDEMGVLKRRLLQVVTGPLYWLARLISPEVWVYHLVLLVVPVVAGLGYVAGFYGFYLMKKMNIRKNPKKKNSPGQRR